jgi:hypothetical protein
MTMLRFNAEQIFQQGDTVAVQARSADLFSLFHRRMDLPAQWAALVTRSTGEQVMVPSGGIIESDKVDEVLLLRTSPVMLEFEEQGLTSADQFQCRAQVTVRVVPVADRGEVLAFRKNMLGSSRGVDVAAMVRYFAPAVRAALLSVVGGRNAVDLVDGAADAEVREALRAKLEELSFSGGMKTEEVLPVQFTSATFSEVRRQQEAAARQQREHEAAQQVEEALRRAQQDHAAHLATLLEQLNTLAVASPQAELADLIRTFSERERGELYEALFDSEPVGPRTQWVVVAAGGELMYFAPGTFTAPERRVEIDGSAGGLRSVQAAHDESGVPYLLLGAATGLYEVPLHGDGITRTLPVPDAPMVRGGFNAAVRVGPHFYGTHSELGIIRWSQDLPEEPDRLFPALTESARMVRDVAFLNGYMYAAVDDRVLRWPADGAVEVPDLVLTGAPTLITSLCVSPVGVLAGTQGGEVLRWPADAGAGTRPEVLHRGDRQADAVVLTTAGGVRRGRVHGSFAVHPRPRAGRQLHLPVRGGRSSVALGVRRRRFDRRYQRAARSGVRLVAGQAQATKRLGVDRLALPATGAGCLPRSREGVTAASSLEWKGVVTVSFPRRR